MKQTEPKKPYRLKKTKAEESVVNAYKKMKKGIVRGYAAVERTFVDGYQRIEDKFVEKFLEEKEEASPSPSRGRDDSENHGTPFE